MSIVRGGLWEVRKIEWLETRGRRTTRVWREIAIFSAALQKCSSNWCAHYKENKQGTKCSIGRSINQTCSVLIMAATMHFVQGTQRHTQTESHQQLQLCLTLVFAWCNWEKSRQENQKKTKQKMHRSKSCFLGCASSESSFMSFSFRLHEFTPNSPIAVWVSATYMHTDMWFIHLGEQIEMP